MMDWLIRRSGRGLDKKFQTLGKEGLQGEMVFTSCLPGALVGHSGAIFDAFKRMTLLRYNLKQQLYIVQQ